MPRWVNLPNLITLLRLALVPFVIVAVLNGQHVLALTLFVIAGVTDILDGAAARHLGVATQTGAYLDPIADKCLLSGAFLALAAARKVPWWLVAVIFGRDLYILAGAMAFMLLGRARKFPPSVWGKASTFVQILTAVAWMARDVLQTRLSEVVSSAMVWPCAVFTVWSGIHYTWLGLRPHVRIDAISARE
ncbi:MAG: CDP-alcohol phosphatidyltransferase family protein [Acidobacteriia bacterium]|nr:CDP-alcohol phosphatidyltransferase family protein [Terriglobia bacterium]